MNETILLIKYSEIHLKGLNRPYFEQLLAKRLREAIRPYGAQVKKGLGRYYVTEIPQDSVSAVTTACSRVFGVHSVAPATVCEKSFDAICAAATDSLQAYLAERPASTFKVEAKRADKRFPMMSMDIAREVGAFILDNVSDISVDVHTPQVTVYVEVREQAYVYTGSVMGPGGMPVGSNGRAMLLLSGGIDSPVAGYMTAKRGVEIEAVHYHSFPYTGEQAKQKVLDLARIMSAYTGPIRLHIVRFTEVQQAIYTKCPHEELTIIMRRYMMDIAQRLAEKNGCLALVTGESIGQVASQTIESLVCTDEVVRMPVFRPCIGMDKEEISEIAKKIGTFDTSILPFEDCCTVFVAKHPVTRPRLANIVRSEEVLDREALIADALSDVETVIISC